MRQRRFLYLFQCNPGQPTRYALSAMKNGDNLPVSDCVAGWRYAARVESLAELRVPRPDDRRSVLGEIDRQGFTVWEPPVVRRDEPPDRSGPAWAELLARIERARTAAQDRDHAAVSQEIDGTLALLRELSGAAKDAEPA